MSKILSFQSIQMIQRVFSEAKNWTIVLIVKDIFSFELWAFETYSRHPVRCECEAIALYDQTASAKLVSSGLRDQPHFFLHGRSKFEEKITISFYPEKFFNYQICQIFVEFGVKVQVIKFLWKNKQMIFEISHNSHH